MQVRVRTIAALAVAVMLLAGCHGGDQGATLHKSDLTDVAKELDVSSVPRGSTCPDLRSAEKAFDAAAASTDEAAWTGDYAEFELKDGSIVDSAVIPSGARSAGLPRTLLAAVSAALDTCAKAGSPTVTRLPGLADGQVGYRDVQKTSSGDQVTERIWAVKGRLAVVVSVQTTGEKSPVSAQDLLPKALDRAKKAPKS